MILMANWAEVSLSWIRNTSENAPLRRVCVRACEFVSVCKCEFVSVCVCMHMCVSGEEGGQCKREGEGRSRGEIQEVEKKPVNV